MTTAAMAPYTDWLNGLEWQPVDAAAYKQLSKEEQLIRVRHSAAHVMAHAIQDLFPDTQFAIGPATPQGFFYDIKTTEPLREEQLEAIQAGVDKVCGQSKAFEVVSIPKAKAVEFFQGINQPHKLDILERIDCEEVTLYRCGDFLDLCAGPHVPHTGLCRNTKVLTLAGAHWRGEDTPTMTRVSGTAWLNPKDLKRYLEFVEESKKRDHRVLGPQLDLFHFHPWGAAAFWHPKGVVFRRRLEAFWRETLDRYDYVEIMNPLLYKKELFEQSGHWDHFQENMFIFKDENGEPEYAIKPMNCPDTMLFFSSKTRSYKDLPMRVAEGQLLHRNEATGAMHGIMRTRMFTQDDAHIFVMPEQIESEIDSLFSMLDEVYSQFKLDYTFSLSTRPEDFMGEPALWDEAEEGLKKALEKTGRPFLVEEGEGAFYGPKIDVQIRDSLGRQWQCGTFQLDFQLPQRFDLKYVTADGSQQQPIVIHRAIFGSFERFMGILIEHMGGTFPTWMAPVQAVVLPIGESHRGYAEQVRKHLKQAGLSVELRDEESVNYRIRNAETQKIPYMLVVGDREAEAGQVSVRQYKVKQQRVLSLDDLQAEMQTKVAEKTFDVQLVEFNDLFRRPSDTISTEEADY